MKGSFKLARIAGIGIFVHWTFSLLLLFIIYLNYRSGHNMEQTLWALVFIVALFFIVTLHELGHALAARRYGIGTKDITLLPIGGVARLEQIPEKPMEELVVAIAGPMVNVVLALIIYPFIPEAAPSPDDEEAVVQAITAIGPDNFVAGLFGVNIILIVFNMIPAFPMDGGRVFRALLSMAMPRHKATLVAARIGQLIAVLFIIAGFYANPFLILIGFFIIFGAQAEAQHTRTNYMLKGAFLRDILMRQYETLQENDTIQAAVSKLLDGQTKNFIVVSEEGTPVGSLSREEIIKGLSASGNNGPIADAMNKQLLRFSPEEPLESAYKQLSEAGVPVALIVEKDKLLGIIDTENIMEFIMVKTAIGEE